jgi:hypothetical protein
MNAPTTATTRAGHGLIKMFSSFSGRAANRARTDTADEVENAREAGFS